ncbi:MAG: hypothetical protein UMU75_01450 [Halomonas sp.]|nr:hypothetical protein [Halomonas sp.]
MGNSRSGMVVDEQFGYNKCPLAGMFLPDPTELRRTPDRTTMQEINPINNLIKDLAERTDVLRGYL